MRRAPSIATVRHSGCQQPTAGTLGFWYWGPPPASATSVLGVGFDPGYLQRFFARVRLVSRLNNDLRVNNDEQLAPLWLATGQLKSWTLAWPQLKISADAGEQAAPLRGLRGETTLA